MDLSMLRGLFVTGTDTGVGKTLVSAALLHAFGARGLRTVGMKPVAAGCEWRDGVAYWDDVEQLRAAANVDAEPALVNPYRFEAPIAPLIAAQSRIKIKALTGWPVSYSPGAGWDIGLRGGAGPGPSRP